MIILSPLSRGVFFVNLDGYICARNTRLGKGGAGRVALHQIEAEVSAALTGRQEIRADA